MASDESKAETVEGNRSIGAAERITVRDLRGGVRRLFALAGMGGLIGGAVAVFVSRNQAGTVALLAVGGIASLLAVVGKVPLRWVIGGHEFDMSEAAAQDVADAVASQLDPTGTAELAGRLAGTEAGGRSPVASAMFEYVAFEQATIGRVMQVIAPMGWSYAHITAPEDRRYDGFVVTQDGYRIPIEYKLVRSTAALNRLRAMIKDRLAADAFEAMVLVVSAAPQVPDVSTLGQREMLAPRGVQLVDANAPEFERRFVAACDDVVAKLRREGNAVH